MNSAQKLLLLDRDGVINYDSAEFIKSPAEWIPIPGSLAAIAKANDAGYRVVVVTNQSGIARGKLSITDLHDIHNQLHTAARIQGARIDGIFYCPHGPDEGCSCRKPLTGLLAEISLRMGCSLDRVPFVGDRGSDIEAALAVGARPILVLTGKGQQTADTWQGPEVETHPDLAQAIDALLAQDE